jgi:hypothetical protein
MAFTFTLEHADGTPAPVSRTPANVERRAGPLEHHPLPLSVGRGLARLLRAHEGFPGRRVAYPHGCAAGPTACRGAGNQPGPAHPRAAPSEGGLNVVIGRCRNSRRWVTGRRG